MDGAGRNDGSTIARINALTGAGLAWEGRAAAGALGGAIFVRWPHGERGVVTVFDGDVAAAERVAAGVNDLVALGVPVPRHDLVVDLGGSVVFIQERLPSHTARRFNAAQVDAIHAINERFAGLGARMTDVPPVTDWFLPAGRQSHHRVMALAAQLGGRAPAVVGHLVEVATASRSFLDGEDVVHVDLNAANVLFDENDRATGVVDWNLGIFTGPRHLALIQTRFDRGWFVQMASSDPEETAAARYLDRRLSEWVDEKDRRAWWAFWLLHWLPKALDSKSEPIITWHLDLAEERVQ